MRRMSARPSRLRWADNPPPLSGTMHARIDRPGRHEPLPVERGKARREGDIPAQESLHPPASYHLSRRQHVTFPLLRKLGA